MLPSWEGSGRPDALSEGSLKPRREWWVASRARRRGQVLLATVNEATMVPFVSGQLGNLELALALARRSNLPGAEALVGQNFERLFAAGQFKEAAEAAAESPQVRPCCGIKL